MNILSNRIIKTTNRVLLSVVAISLLISAPHAQPSSSNPQPSEDRIALYQALLDLTNPWTVMCIAAHPDDEDGTSLIVMRRKYGAHTVSLFSTFGEGGQNAIGPELYEEMGAIRARETMAAAEIQGSEPHFLGLKDFGYSKSADEAFRFWGHEEALRRMVLEIRKLRPDVIITNHSVASNDHGHHQATARLELEAFDAAADPSRFPEQLKDGVTTWRVQRLFVRARGNQTQTDNAGLVTIDPNERDQVRGVVYAEEALRALQKHATQGPWPKTFAEFANRFRAFSGQNAAPGQLPLVRYALVKQREFLTPLPPGSHNFLDGMALTGESARQLAPPTLDGKSLTDLVDQREKVLDALVAASKQHIFGEERKETQGLLADLRRARMLVRLNKSLAIASGVSARLMAANDVLIPGETASFELAVTNSGADPIRVSLIASGTEGDQKDDVVLSAQHHVNSPVPAGETIKIPTTYRLSKKAPLTVPHSSHLYDKEFAGTPVVAAAFIELKGIKFPIMVQKLSDVAPPVEIVSANPSPLVVIPATAAKNFRFTLRIQNHKASGFAGSVYYDFGSRHQVRLNGGTLRLEPNKTQDVVEEIPSFCKSVATSANLIHCISDAIPFSVSYEAGKDDLSSASGRTVKIIAADASVAPNLRVGYVRGFDYSLPNALNALGVESKELSVAEVKTADLQKYSSIIVDNRVYESQPELIAANQKLLDYANAGGTLIVFYHKSDEWNPDSRRNRPQLAPYKLMLGNERITDENAPITFIEPQHPLLNLPNKIGQEDFVGWIQERGLYYPKEWDPQFHALLQSNDPGEAPLKGGLLVADYGRGHYIYSSMVWYRELRGGVPGAYRMLANMISYGREEGKRQK